MSGTANELRGWAALPTREALARCRVLVVGDVMLDRYWFGDVTRISPEAPVPVLKPIEEKSNDGMAGNVVENIKLLSPNVEILHWYQSTPMEKVRYVEKKTNRAYNANGVTTSWMGA